MKRLDALRDLVAKHIDKAREKQEGYYNREKKNVVFNLGDLAMRRVKVLSDASKRFSAKLAPKYEGPFEIVEKSPTLYVLGEGEGSNRRKTKIHVSELKRYIRPRVGVACLERGLRPTYF